MTRRAREPLHDGWVICGLSVLNLMAEGGLRSTVAVGFLQSIHALTADRRGLVPRLLGWLTYGSERVSPSRLR